MIIKCPQCDTDIDIVMDPNFSVIGVHLNAEGSVVVTCPGCGEKASVKVVRTAEFLVPANAHIDVNNIGWSDLKGVYLRGVMDAGDRTCDDDMAMFLFVRIAGIDHTLYAYSKNMDYSYYNRWNVRREERVIPRDDAYKAIGDLITEVLINDDDRVDDEEWAIRLITPTKVIEYSIDWSDVYYPSALWGDEDR